MNQNADHEFLERQLDQLGANERLNLDPALEDRLIRAMRGAREDQSLHVVAAPWRHWRRHAAAAAVVAIAGGAALTAWLMNTPSVTPSPVAEWSIEDEFNAWLDSDFMQSGLVEHASLRQHIDAIESNLDALWPNDFVLLDEEMM